MLLSKFVKHNPVMFQSLLALTIEEDAFEISLVLIKFDVFYWNKSWSNLDDLTTTIVA